MCKIAFAASLRRPVKNTAGCLLGTINIICHEFGWTQGFEITVKSNWKDRIENLLVGGAI